MGIGAVGVLVLIGLWWAAPRYLWPVRAVDLSLTVTVDRHEDHVFTIALQNHGLARIKTFLNLDEFEGIIHVRSKNGPDLELGLAEYFTKMMTSIWVPARYSLDSGGRVEWHLALDDLRTSHGKLVDPDDLKEAEVYASLVLPMGDRATFRDVELVSPSVTLLKD